MKFIQRQLPFSILFSLSFTLLYAQPFEQKIDSIASQHFSISGPGGSILISKNDTLLFEKAYGLANLEHKVPMQTDMVFEIGSITKQFTAVAILQLMEQKKVALHESIRHYFPELPESYQGITLHHLLTHTSGIPNFTNDARWSEVWRSDMTMAQTLELFIHKPLEFQPGERFSYCNSGYVLLGALIEKVTELSYGAYLKAHIFDPLGMTQTFMGSRGNIIPHRVQGYQKNTDYVNAEYVTFTQTHAAGALMSTPYDLFKWYRGLYQYRLITKATLALATTNYSTLSGESINYGYGWFINEVNGQQTIEHGGGIFGFIAYALYIPKDAIFVTVLTNYELYNPEALSVQLAHVITASSHQKSQVVTLKKKELQKWVGTYQFDDGITRTIVLEERTLFSQIPGRPKIALVPVSQNAFHFQGIWGGSIEFQEKKKKVTAVLRNRIMSKKGYKVDLKSQHIESIVLSDASLEKLTGTYALGPQLTFTLAVEGSQLYAVFPGQDRLALYATSATTFFAKDFPVNLVFELTPEGQVAAVKIKQQGQIFTATKAQ